MIRKFAIALIILNILSAGSGYVIYLQTKYQLVSPLVPNTVILDIVDPYIQLGLISLAVVIASFTLFLYSKYSYAVAICAANLLIQQIYLISLGHL
jgi:hypothetical protein